MKIYIAGKITGDDYYKQKFKSAESLIKSHGHIALNPAVLPEGMQPADYMRICLAMIDASDAILFLPDWKDSNGAAIERNYCIYTNKKYIKLEHLGSNADIKAVE